MFKISKSLNNSIIITTKKIKNKKNKRINENIEVNDVGFSLLYCYNCSIQVVMIKLKK